MDHTWTTLASCCYAPNHHLFLPLCSWWRATVVPLCGLFSELSYWQSWACFIVLVAGGEAQSGPPFVFVPSTHLSQYAPGEYLQHAVNAASLLWIRVIKARKLDFAMQRGQLVLSLIALKNASQLETHFPGTVSPPQPDEHSHLSIVNMVEYLHDSPGREPQFLLSRFSRSPVERVFGSNAYG